MPPAIGQSNPNPLPTHGPLWFDAREFGVSMNNPDNGPALQAAHDAAAAAVAASLTADGAKVPTATVFIPASKGAYPIRTPVFVDSSYVEFRGERGGTRVAMTPTFGFPPFIVGVPRIGRGKVPDATYRPDLWNGGNPKLDSTVVSGPGQKWGLRTNTDAYMLCPTGVFSHGPFSPTYPTLPDSWHETPQLTIDFAIEGFASGQVPGGASLFGLGSNGYGPSTPFTICTSAPNTYVLLVSTQAAKFGPAANNYYSFSSGSATGVQRITVQIDLPNRQVTAYVNGIQVAVSGGGVLPGGVSLNENQYDVFVINQNGSAPPGSGSADFGLYGLCLSRSIRYANNGVGQPQVRADGGQISDGYRFYSPSVNYPPSQYDANAIGHLQFTENPATAPRHLTIAGGPAAGGRACSALLLNGNSFGIPVVENRFTDLQINAEQCYGMAVCLGNVLSQYFSGVNAFGGLYGIGNLVTGANYVIRLSNCYLAGNDSGYFGYASLIEMDTITFANNGRVAMRLAGCNLNARNIFVTAAGAPQYALAMFTSMDYGGGYSITNVICDNEGTTYDLAGIYCERHSYVSTQLYLDNIYFGTVGGVPLIQLKDVGEFPAFPSAYIEARGVSGDATYSIVDVDGPGWAGLLSNCSADNASHVTNLRTFGTPRLVVEDRSSKTPPRYGSWIAGTSQLVIAGPVDGQFQEMRVAADGTYGSMNPPQWVGLNPIQANANASLAAYALDHTAIAATLSGQASSWGYLTNQSATALATALLGGTPMGTSTTLTIGGGPTGGSFTLSYGGQTTPGIAWNAPASVVQSALQALPTIGAGNVAVAGGYSGGFNPYSIYFTGSLANIAGAALGLTANASALTGGAPTATLAPSALPSTWYVGLSMIPAGKLGRCYEPGSSTGYARVALANSAASFSAASGGSKANAVAVTFPVTSQAYTVDSIFLADAPAGGNVWAVIQLAQPLTVNPGMAPSIPVGALTFTHVPSPGAPWGTLTDYAWSKLYDLIFRGSSFVLPATWYAALATTAVSRSTTALAEPTGNGYARAAIANTAQNWVQPLYSQSGDVLNTNAITFPVPTGSWGTIVSAALTDSATGGNVWFVAGLPLPIAPASGTTAPRFAAGALTVAMA
jgi:hypothetical protein